MITNVTGITSCYMGPAISPEQFIPQHFFLYLGKGKIDGYDGYTHSQLKQGEYCLARKNHLARYNKEKANGEFAKVVIVFDEPFLRAYQKKYKMEFTGHEPGPAFVKLKKNPAVPAFILSLMPYYQTGGRIDETVADSKRTELLHLLLADKPGLANILFDFGIPAKLDLEAFMNRNYKFNVTQGRFAYLTGRSISAFKRDFKQIFSETPNRWLMKKRLEEAHFLLGKSRQMPSDIYLDLGFEDLSHFSFAFKKRFGVNPTGLRTAGGI